MSPEVEITPLSPPLRTAAGEFVFPRHVHLLGVGGAGVSGLARHLAARGLRVSGHDRTAPENARELEKAGIVLASGDSAAAFLPDAAELVVRSAAVSAEDPQVRAARARGIPVWKYAEALGKLAPAGRTLAVAGTHGKTGSSWMLWHALDGIGEAFGLPMPGAQIGGSCRRNRTNAIPARDGAFFCAEACEYDRSFLQLAPAGALVTNVEADHLDYYGTFAAIQEAFARFVDRVEADGIVVLGRDVPAAVEHAVRGTVWRLGRELSPELLGETRGAFAMRLLGPGWATPRFQLAIPGHFSVENAALAVALAVGLTLRRTGLPARDVAAAAARGIERFQGVARRFEPWGEVGGTHVVHDYAHHPTEVRVTLEAARRAYPRMKLCVLFQPHQHSRTARFLAEFAEALRQADFVTVADVYGARAHVEGELHAGAPELVLALKRRGVAAVEGGAPGEAARVFARHVPAQAAAFVLGAGDIDRQREALLAALALR
jgi:UDP-N-acetylmuramate--alanine ligase